jgi:hypothetical protein
MGWGIALSKIPWKLIMPYIPSVVETAKDLLRAATKTGQDVKATAEITAAELADRVAQLEANERKQAELVQAMAEQQERLTASLRILESRLQLLFVVTLVLLIALIAMLVYMFLHAPVR